MHRHPRTDTIGIHACLDIFAFDGRYPEGNPIRDRRMPVHRPYRVDAAHDVVAKKIWYPPAIHRNDNVMIFGNIT